MLSHGHAETPCLVHLVLTLYKVGARQPSLQAFPIMCIRAESEDPFLYLTAPDVFPEPSILSQRRHRSPRPAETLSSWPLLVHLEEGK